jgi:hypothetical protein
VAFSRRWVVLWRGLTGAWFFLLLMIVGVTGSQSLHSRDVGLAFKALGEIRGYAHLGEEGYWTGDVAGLYERGKISREIAEADFRPLKPLVAQPRPYHGYLFVAMDSGPDMSADGTDIPISLKGKRVTKGTCAFCAFPAEKGPNKRVYLFGPAGDFGKTMEGGVPVLEWPRALRKTWAIID